MAREIGIGDWVRVACEGRARTGQIVEESESGEWWSVRGLGWVRKRDCTRIKPSQSGERAAQRVLERIDRATAKGKVYGDGEI